MPAKPKKIALILSGTLLVFALACAYFDWYGVSHHRVWSDVFHGLMLLNLLLILFFLYLFPGNRPAPNPLIGLFPKPQPPQKDHTL